MINGKTFLYQQITEAGKISIFAATISFFAVAINTSHD